MSSVLMLFAACSVEPVADGPGPLAAGRSDVAVRIALSSRGEGEIEPCG